MSTRFESPYRPHRIALVLGSGGVRSAAALGIAEVLQESGLTPTLYVGCSSGALFAALLAAQIPPRDAMASAVALWSQDLTKQHRWRAYGQLLLPRLLGFDAGFALRDSRLIRRRIEQAFGSPAIEQLPARLRVVATDAASGARVVLRSGRLVDALCASMAVPFIFAPVEVDGRCLIDGVISDPLPVSAAVDADVVITLGFEGSMPRRIARPSHLLGQVSTALMNNLMQARIDAAAAAAQTLVAIQPTLQRRVGLWETAAIPEICHAGREAATAALPQIFRALEQGVARERRISPARAAVLSAQ